MERHRAMNQEAAKGTAQLAFIGDSITHAFGGEPRSNESFADRGKDTWDLFYGDRHAINLGISGDRTQHVLWRLENGNLDGIKPKVAVVMIGTNNSGSESASQIAEGVEAVCLKVKEKSPKTKILLLAVFPRGNADSPERAKLTDTNRQLESWAKEKRIEFMDIGSVFLDARGEIPNDVMPDKLHPFAFGYRKWAMAIEPKLSKLFGDKSKCNDDPKNSAVVPVTQQRDSYNWIERHQAVLTYMAKHKPSLLFIGDSITHMWGGPPTTPGWDRGLAAWTSSFARWNPADLGYGWDRTENVLWRLEQGELDGVDPKAVVLLIGTNNLHLNTSEEIRDGIDAILSKIQQRAPKCKIILVGILPRDEKPDGELRLKAAALNKLLPEVAKRHLATYLDLGNAFVGADGMISKEIMFDFLHPTPRGYEILAKGLQPILERILK